MSLVEITDHNEVIYTILDKPPPEPPKTPRYHSELEKELKIRKIPQLRRTFGYAITPVNPPDKFLKKGQGLSQPIKKSDHVHYTTGNLPPVPKRPPPEPKPQKPVVNFRVVNIKKAIREKGRPVQPRLVDTRDGHIKNIKGSGEVPEFCKLPGFGKMPGYLVKRNRRIQRALDKAKEAEENRESLCQLVSAEERLKLLEELKAKWAVMQKNFLQLPMLTDTPPKILKKTKMEQELNLIEKDIGIIESNPFIYVFEDLNN